MVSNQCNSIMSLNEFNITGDYLASGTGLYVAYWKAKQPASNTRAARDGPGGSSRKDGDSDDDDDDDDPKFEKPSYPGTSKKKQPTKKDTKNTSKSKCTKRAPKK